MHLCFFDNPCSIFPAPPPLASFIEMWWHILLGKFKVYRCWFDTLTHCSDGHLSVSWHHHVTYYLLYFSENLLAHGSVKMFIFLHVGGSFCCVCSDRFSVIFFSTLRLFSSFQFPFFVEAASSPESPSCCSEGGVSPHCFFSTLLLVTLSSVSVSVTLLCLDASSYLYLLLDDMSSICVKRDWVWIWEMC